MPRSIAPGHRWSRLRLTFAVVLFVGVVIGSGLNDVINVFSYADDVAQNMPSWRRPGNAHLMYHLVVPSVALLAVAVVVPLTIAVGPARRREAWAIRALAVSGATFVALKLWGSLAFYPHWETGVGAPTVVWLLAACLAWPELRESNGR